MKRPQIPVPSRRGLVVGAWAVALLTLALIIWMLWLLFNLQDSAETSSADRDRLTADVAEQGELLAEQQAQLDKANARLVEAGERPVNVPPEIVEGIPGKPGPAPTFAQVLSAVETYCSGLVCVGPAGADGRAGAPGEDGRDGQDGAAGSDGRDGAPGADGEDGQDGAMGPAGPKGDKGDKGDKGEQGEPGPPQSCASEFVCAGELDAALASYYTKGEVVSLLRALGCTVSTDAGNPNQVFTCTITGKP